VVHERGRTAALMVDGCAEPKAQNTMLRVRSASVCTTLSAIRIQSESLIDYPVAIVLIAAPFVLKLGQSGPIAMWLSVVVGVAALLLAALTDHPTGLVRIIPYWLHLWVDRAVGVVFVIAPFGFKFVGLDAWYYWVLAAAVLLTTSVFNAPEESVATRSGLDTRTAG